MEFEVQMCSTQKTIQLIQWTKARHTPDQWCATTNTKNLNKKHWNIATIQEMPHVPKISKAGGAFTKVQLEILSVRLSKLFKGCPPFDPK